MFIGHVRHHNHYNKDFIDCYDLKIQIHIAKHFEKVVSAPQCKQQNNDKLLYGRLIICTNPAK